VNTTNDVGDCERHFQDAVVGADAEAHTRHGALEQAPAVGGDVAALADLERADYSHSSSPPYFFAGHTCTPTFICSIPPLCF